MAMFNSYLKLPEDKPFHGAFHSKSPSRDQPWEFNQDLGYTTIISTDFHRHSLSQAGQLQGASQHSPASCVLGHDDPESLDGPQANLVSMDSRLQAVRYYLTHNIWMYL